ncbi:MAG: 50S ribosomal protein L18e [archaeon]
MKRTGPTKEKTKKIISLLKKNGKNKKIWKDLANRIAAPRRKRASINLWRLETLSEQFKEKTLIVPGKVLAKGKITKAISVAALEFSGKAEEKIKEKKGKTFNLEEAVKINPKELIIVK